MQGCGFHVMQHDDLRPQVKLLDMVVVTTMGGPGMEEASVSHPLSTTAQNFPLCF